MKKSKPKDELILAPVRVDKYKEALTALSDAKDAVYVAVEHARKMSLAVVKAKEDKKRHG